MPSLFASWTELASLMSQDKVRIFSVDIDMFSNLTRFLLGKRRSEDVVSGNILEDKDELSQPVALFTTPAWLSTGDGAPC